MEEEKLPSRPPLPRDPPPALPDLRPIITPLKGSRIAQPNEFKSKSNEFYDSSTFSYASRASQSQPSRKKTPLADLRGFGFVYDNYDYGAGAGSPNSQRFSLQSPSLQSPGSPPRLTGSARSTSPSQRSRGMHDSGQSWHSQQSRAQSHGSGRSWQDVCAQMDENCWEDPTILRAQMNTLRASTPPGGKTHLTGYRKWVRPHEGRSKSPGGPGRGHQGPRQAAGAKDHGDGRHSGAVREMWPSPF